MKTPNFISPDITTISGPVHLLYGFSAMHKLSLTHIDLKKKKKPIFINTILWPTFISFIYGTNILMMNILVDSIFCYLK